MTRVVSYSLFESSASVYAQMNGRSLAQFVQFLPLIIRAHHVLWRDWELRIHHDEVSKADPYFRVLEKLHDRGLVNLVYMGQAERLCEAMLWRMAPAFDPEVDAVVCRDLDVIPGPLDRMAVEEWYETGRAVHVIHFAGAHSGIMGGTLALRPAKFLPLIECNTLHCFCYQARKHGISLEKHGDDQHWLNSMYGRLCPDMLLHELHHDVGDLPAAEIRQSIMQVSSWSMPLTEEQVEMGFGLSKGIGVCDEPAPALAFYDSLDLPIIKQIQECEK